MVLNKTKILFKESLYLLTNILSNQFVSVFVVEILSTKNVIIMCILFQDTLYMLVCIVCTLRDGKYGKLVTES